MTDTPKTINRSTYLQALGLYTLASIHRAKVDDAREELLRLLGVENNGHIDDEIYSPNRGFDEALKLEGFTVADDPA
jgi:hypothetical protein